MIDKQQFSESKKKKEVLLSFRVPFTTKVITEPQREEEE